MTRIKMRISVRGGFHGYTDVKRGQVVEVDDLNAQRYVKLGYAQSDLTGEPGRPYEAATW
jgi:hypothetical protein